MNRAQSDELPSVNESANRLRRAGWSVGEVGTGSSWLILGSNRRSVLRAEGQTQREAWARAVEQARALGMLGAAAHAL